MFRRIKFAIVFVAAANVVGLTGCWHQKTQQQKYLEALNRGNGAQAAEIWRNMDADSRAALAHNEGIKPKLSPSQIQQQVMQHYGADSDPDAQDTIESVTPHVGSGGLETLPEYTAAPGGGTPTVIVPSTTMPPN